MPGPLRLKSGLEQEDSDAGKSTRGLSGDR